MVNHELSDKLNNIHPVFFSCCERGFITHISENVTGYFSIEPSQCRGKHVSCFMPHTQVKSIVSRCTEIKNSQNTGTFPVFLNIDARGTRYYTLSITYSDEGRYYGTIKPISKGLNNIDEQAFRQMEMMRATLEAIDDVVFILDKNLFFSGYYNQANKEEHNGTSPVFTVGSHFFDAGFPTDVENLYIQAINEAQQNHQTNQISYAIKAFGGEIHYQSKVSPRFTINNEFDGVTIIIRDVSGIIKSEEKLKKSLDFYLTVLENFPNPIFRFNTFKKFDYFNKHWLAFTGILAENLNEITWKNFIYPPDLQGFIKEFDESFRRRISFSLEFRLIYHSGEYHWVKCFCQPVFDLKGRFNGYIGSCFDIDAIRHNQKLLQESESRFRAMLHDQSDMVVRWSPNFQISFVNKSFSDFFESEKENLIGQSWIRIFDEDEKTRIEQQLGELITSRATGYFEAAITNHRYGCLYYQWLNTPVFDDEQKLIEYQSVGRDITDKIEKEKENQNLLQRLNEKVKELSLINNLSRYINDGLSEEYLFRNLVNDISASLDISQIICTRIDYEDNSWYNTLFSIPENSSEISFSFGNEKRGRIRIYNDRDRGKSLMEGLVEERQKGLLKTLCDMLNSHLLKLETEKKLLQSEMRFSELFENVMDIVFSIDCNGVIRKINSAATKILGYDSFEGANLWDFAAPSERKSIYAIINNVLSQKLTSFTIDTKVLSSEGDMVFLQIAMIVKYNQKKFPLEIFGIARDITQQKRIEQNIVKTIINTEEKERKRFAEDLHDGIGPLLSGLKMYLQQEALEKGLTRKQQDVLKYCRELVDDAINQTRSIANNLTPGILNDFGLQKALVSHVAKINAIGKFNVTLTTHTSLSGVENDIGIAIFRIISELLNNSLKHSECTTVEITIDIRKNILSLIYRDNGKGFDKEAVHKAANIPGMGILNINNRVHSLNGSINIESSTSEGGVFVKIFIPLKKE